VRSFLQRRVRSASRTKLHQEIGRESEKSLGEADESATGSTFFLPLSALRRAARKLVQSGGVGLDPEDVRLVRLCGGGGVEEAEPGEEGSETAPDDLPRLPPERLLRDRRGLAVAVAELDLEERRPRPAKPAKRTT
jgi:hypothetical protein